MRIISGIYRNRIIKQVPITSTRETSDKVRGAIFNSINNYIENSITLDLFSGSGAMGIESLSRGAKKAFFNDLNIIAYRTIKDNLNALKITDMNILNLDYKEALLYYTNKLINFDIIFLDPPYKLDIINDIINYILENNLLNKFGIIVCEYSDYIPNDNFPNLELIKKGSYGIKKISIYRNEE